MLTACDDGCYLSNAALSLPYHKNTIKYRITKSAQRINRPAKQIVYPLCLHHPHDVDDADDDAFDDEVPVAPSQSIIYMPAEALS